MNTPDIKFLQFLLSEPWFRIRSHVKEAPERSAELANAIRNGAFDNIVFDDELENLPDLADEIQSALIENLFEAIDNYIA